MRPDQTAEISEMSKVLAPQQPTRISSSLRTARVKVGWNIAGFCRTGEIQGLAERQEIADPVHLHTERSSMASRKRDNRRTSL
jgi:hypothetical protein